MAPWWVRYETPISNPPHMDEVHRDMLRHFGINGTHQIRHRSGAVYTIHLAH